jgi:probable HAF family extracellular repeat protein
VGFSKSAFGGEAFRWTAGGGMIGLGDLPGGVFSSSADGVSSDGSVVVGSSNSAFGGEAFRWTAGDGMVGMGVLPGDNASHAMAPSANGSVIVGTSNQKAFLWTASGGMRSLRDILTADLGLDLTGWRIDHCGREHQPRR